MRPGPGNGFGGPAGMLMPVQKPKNMKGTLSRLIRYFRPYTLRLLLVVLATLFGTAFSILSPKIMGNVTTDLFAGVSQKFRGVSGGGVDFLLIARLLLLLGGLYIFSSLLSYIQQYIMAGVAQKAVSDLRSQVNEKLSRLPISYFDTHPHGEILSRFINDFDNISSTLQQSLTQALSAVVTFIGVFVMMLSISPLMTLAVVLTLPLSFVVTKAIAKRSQNQFKLRQHSLGALNGHIEEMFTGHQVVKAFGYETTAKEKLATINEAYYEAAWKAQFVTGIIMPIMNFIGNLSYVLVCVIGGILVTYKRLQIGDILAFIQYSRQFSQPINQLSSISNVIQSTLASSERVFEMLDEQEEEDPREQIAKDAAHPCDDDGQGHEASGRSAEAVRFEGTDQVFVAERSAESVTAKRGRVVFENVSFRYKVGEPLIENLSLRAEPGQKIAIVGPTGAGKTTLINLLLRFYEQDAGTILLDGVDIKTFPRAALRQKFGMVLQDTWLFHGTIFENIAYGRKGATEAEVIAAAKASYADSFIRKLPDGYATHLNEETSNLSQGQKQLLTIARAFLANPTILILDEATSSVDTRTEIHIQHAMKRLMDGRTSFVIAHRLSTVRDADCILVMNHGRVVEQGAHDALIEQDGFYAELYKSQFASALPEFAALEKV
ncbi:ABC transporter ATP-binding protein [Ferroacidibacillus organovorans]|uniref:ABC transporter n=1 Tax=Ferroacidibacillus organovorans TaxID=1765683 RepID=A0A124IWF1_9BACL|nr:ABC transporter ATP-binding protein [Ferroacidibacillus organovorans]KUO97201.1 ABC transporter [Ferroacidibacillus organovorans]